MQIYCSHNLKGSYKSISAQFCSVKLYQNIRINQTFLQMENTPSQIGFNTLKHTYIQADSNTDSTLLLQLHS